MARTRSRRASAGLLVLLTSCSLGAGVRDLPRTAPPAPIVPASCPPDGDGLELPGFGFGPGPARGSVPSGFTAQSVLTCGIIGERRLHGQTNSFTARAASGPATPELTAALALPDQEFTSDHYGCDLSSTTKPFLLLVETRQRAIRPHLPEDPCGKVRPEVLSAIQQLALTEVDRYTFRGSYVGR